jgi:SHS2 domain-containing protein
VSAPGHRFVDHTADLMLEAWAGDEAGVLVEAARALVAAMTEQAIAAAEERTLTLQAIDPEDRMVRWLNEVLYWAAVEGFFVAEAELTLEPPGTLRARVRGGPATAQTELKSVTYHEATLRRDGDRMLARVVIDV